MNPDTQVTVPWRVHSTPFDRPVTLHVRNVTYRQMRQQQAWYAAWRERVQADNLDAVMGESIARGIAGWSEPEPFSFDALADVFAFDDIVRIALNWPDALRPTEADEGKSTSPQGLPPVASAAIA